MISLTASQFAKLKKATAATQTGTRSPSRLVIPKGQPPIKLEAVLIADHIEKRLDPRDTSGGIRLLLREGICTLRLTLHGVARTKKNSQRLFSLPNSARRVVPSAAYCAWFEAAKTAVMLAKLGDLKLNFDMNFEAVFFMPKDNCDLTGLKDGLADFAQGAGLITNDKLIRTWDGSKVVIDRDRPRVEVLISVTAGVGN